MHRTPVQVWTPSAVVECLSSPRNVQSLLMAAVVALLSFTVVAESIAFDIVKE